MVVAPTSVVKNWVKEALGKLGEYSKRPVSKRPVSMSGCDKSNDSGYAECWLPGAQHFVPSRLWYGFAVAS